MSRLFKNVIGSAVVEKILMTLISISLCVSGGAYINKQINNAILEQNNSNNIVNVLDYWHKDKNIIAYKNSVHIDIDKPIYSVYIDIFCGKPAKWHSSPPFNTKITVPEDCTSFQITFCVSHITKEYHPITFDPNLVRGKSFYFYADVSPDKKTVSNIRISFDETAKFPNLL